MRDYLNEAIHDALKAEGLKNCHFTIEHPIQIEHGEFSTNAALVCAKQTGQKPVQLAAKLAEYLKKSLYGKFEKIEVAGPGFINFFPTRSFFAEALNQKIEEGDEIGKNKSHDGKRVLVEYTDPNAFKPFHIGHLMSNAIGEAISRLYEFQGAKVARICYPSDIGLHIAKAVWGMIEKKSEMPNDYAPVIKRTAFLGQAYVLGTKMYEEDAEVKKTIDVMNGQLFSGSNPELEKLYEKGRKWSLEHFGLLYRKLGTKFDNFIYESDVASDGIRIVKDFLKEGIFEESEGAVVFKGEKYGLHTRVFLNARGLPTYEAKELGLNMKKFAQYPDATKSIIITGNEQNDYFKVLIKVMGLINKSVGEKTEHIGHGMLRLPSGKMSSRTGNAITAEILLEELEKMTAEKIKDRSYDPELAKDIVEKVSVGAMKYSVLRQETGGDIVYDFEKSISFEGDSGPYLQYACARAKSVLEKAKAEKIKADLSKAPQDVSLVERLVLRFPEVVRRSGEERAPHLVGTYLIELAGAFNNFYASEQIVNREDVYSPYKVALTRIFHVVMRNGLWLLGIEVPVKM